MVWPSRSDATAEGLGCAVASLQLTLLVIKAFHAFRSVYIIRSQLHRLSDYYLALPLTMSIRTRVANVVISTTTSQHASADKCIPVLRVVVLRDGSDRWEMFHTKIAMDDVAAVQNTLKKYTDGVDCVNPFVTSGVAGFHKGTSHQR